jgi:hypothetical protein
MSGEREKEKDRSVREGIAKGRFECEVLSLELGNSAGDPIRTGVPI